MKETLRIVLVIPLAAWMYYLWFVRADKIKWPWFMAGLCYSVGYIAIFHYWLRTM
jgi:hypothetical protein